MATRALLLSGDEQAVGAVTQTLEELDFAFEHSNEPSFGIARLANRRFNPILVDCDDEDNATLVFNYVQGSALNKTSIVVAIVDGKAGVPTAFRLGANLVLTKPVSLEQAKSTLRAAVVMLRREAHAERAPLERSAAALAQNAVSTAPVQSLAVGNEPTQSAHAVSTPMSNSGSAAPGAGHSTIDEIRSSFAVPRASAGSVTPKKTAAATPEPAPACLSDPGLEDDDPILAELRELESGNAALPPPSFQAPEERRRNKAPLLTVVAVVLAAAGAYVAWTTQPRLRNLVAHEHQKLQFRMAGFRGQPEPVVSTTPAQPPSQAAGSASMSSAQPSAAQTVQPANTTTSNSDPTANPASKGTPVAGTRASATSLENIKQDNTADRTAAFPDLVPATATTTQRPGTNTSPELLVLSEDAADDNVVHRVRPVYPRRARQKRVHGSVVLQATVNKAGRVDSVRVVAGNPLLAQAAKDAVKQWRYKPYFHNGKAAAFETQVTVDFRLP